MKELQSQLKYCPLSWKGRRTLFRWWLGKLWHALLLRWVIIGYNRRHPYIEDAQVWRYRGIAGFEGLSTPSPIPKKLWATRVPATLRCPFP
jgi:hypothetical protein